MSRRTAIGGREGKCTAKRSRGGGVEKKGAVELVWETQGESGKEGKDTKGGLLKPDD